METEPGCLLGEKREPEPSFGKEVEEEFRKGAYIHQTDGKGRPGVLLIFPGRAEAALVWMQRCLGIV